MGDQKEFAQVIKDATAYGIYITSLELPERVNGRLSVSDIRQRLEQHGLQLKAVNGDASVVTDKQGWITTPPHIQISLATSTIEGRTVVTHETPVDLKEMKLELMGEWRQSERAIKVQRRQDGCINVQDLRNRLKSDGLHLVAVAGVTKSGLKDAADALAADKEGWSIEAHHNRLQLYTRSLSIAVKSTIPTYIVCMAKLELELDVNGRANISKLEKDLKETYGFVLKDVNGKGIPSSGADGWSFDPFPGFKSGEWRRKVTATADPIMGTTVSIIPFKYHFYGKHIKDLKCKGMRQDACVHMESALAELKAQGYTLKAINGKPVPEIDDKGWAKQVGEGGRARWKLEGGKGCSFGNCLRAWFAILFKDVTKNSKRRKWPYLKSQSKDVAKETAGK